MALVSGCQHEELMPAEQNVDVMEVYATIEDIDDGQTRTYLSGTDVFWSSGDQIAVFMANTLRKRFNVTPESIDSKDATFQYDSQYIITGKNDNISHNVAYYPFCDVTCAPDGSSYTLGNLTLPSTQSYVEGSVGLGAYPMVAVTENTDDVNFCFRNLCGVMQFQLKGYGFVKSVSVKGNRGEILAGPAVVTAGYGNDPSIAMSSEGTKEVTLDCGESGVELNETTPVSFFIALPPVQFEGGFTITVTDTWGGSKEYSTSKKNPVGRSKGLRMPAKEYIGVRPPQEGDYIDEYGVNHGQGIEIDGVVWAPVNCGYKAPTADSKGFPYGKLYQWGRKYGQGYDDSDECYPSGDNLVEGSVSLVTGQSQDSEDCFYKIKFTTYDWLDTQENRLWNMGEEVPVKSELDPCPDGWRVPTYIELEKLCENKSSWTTNNIGQGGYWFSASNAYTLAVLQIFLPATGGRGGDGEGVGRNKYGHYWTATSYVSWYGYSYSLWFSEDDISINSGGVRCWSRAVRCVQDKSELVPVTSVTLNSSSLTLTIGKTATVTANISPSNANHKSAYWWSEDESIATVDSNGKITAVAEGTTTIIAMAGMQTAQCEVTVVAAINYVDEYGENHGPGIKIGETVWAPVNCGYKKDDYPCGRYYQWGRKYGQKYSPRIMNGPAGESALLDEKYADIFFWAEYGTPFDWYIGNDSTLWNMGTEEKPIKTKYDPCPEGWRVPTFAELTALGANRDSGQSTHNGQKGYWFNNPEKNSGTNGVFLPSAGYIFYDAGSYEYGEEGCYWSSTPYQNYYSLRYSFTRTSTRDYCRGNGFSVRCVQE